MLNEATARRRGLDHDLFPFRTIRDTVDFRLPGEARIAVNLIIVLQRFHIDAKPPFPVPGMIDRPYPDVGNATQREVGLRSGFWRIREAIEQFGISATFVVERDALELLEGDLDILRDERHDVIAGGLHAAKLHTAAMPADEEREIIRGCRDTLSRTLGRPIKGWRSPSCAQSPATLDLLAECGFAYCGDYNNDDRPYVLAAKAANLVAMPMHHFSSDLHNLAVMKQPTEMFFGSVVKGAQWILGRKEEPSVILPLVIHPWVTGAPHRFHRFRPFLADLFKLDGVVSASCGDLAETFTRGGHAAQLRGLPAGA